MSVVTLSEFKDIISSMLHQDPRRDRLTEIHPSAELYDASGNTIVGLKIKFYIEDDGGDWDLDGLVKPEFIWDMIHIAGGVVVDSGKSTNHSPLLGSNCKDNSDGMYFIGSSSSSLKSNGAIQFTPSMSDYVLNIWFSPENNDQISEPTELVSLYSMTNRIYYPFKSSTDNPIWSLKIRRIDDNFSNIYLWFMDNAANPRTIDLGRVQTNVLSNLIIKFGESDGYYLLNGEMSNMIPMGTPLKPLYTGFFSFGEKYKGNINYVTLNIGSLDSSILKKMHSFGYPLPRSKELVDLSDNLTRQGQDVFIEVGNLSKAIENLKGQLYVKSNSIKVRN
jgi:hypothetical protein